MENKSEQLAKLLGIEPHIQADYCYWECKNPKKQFHACRKKTCNHFKKGCITYPDFTKPSNFVKLLEILTTKYLFGIAFEDNEVVIEGFPYYDHKRESLSELLINGLIVFLESEYGDCEDSRDLERCKKTYQEPAQQTEWEY